MSAQTKTRKKAKAAKKKTVKSSTQKEGGKATKKAAKKKAAKKGRKTPKGGTRKADKPAKAASKKAKALRKDPDLEIDQEVLAFIAALEEYKKKNNRLFPSNSEILQVLKDMGYKKT